MSLVRTDAENLKAHVEGMCYRVYDQLEHVENLLSKNPNVMVEVEAMFGKAKADDCKACINRARALLRAVEHHKSVEGDLK